MSASATQGGHKKYCSTCNISNPDCHTWRCPSCIKINVYLSHQTASVTSPCWWICKNRPV